MHINNLSIPLIPANDSRHNNKLPTRHEIPYTAFILPGCSGEVEFQCRSNLNEEKEQGADRGGETDGGPHGGAQVVCRLIASVSSTRLKTVS